MTTPLAIRRLMDSDKALWAEMRAALWPEESPHDHARWIDQYLSDGSTFAFVVETAKGEPAGFAEVSIRKYANGCETAPVPFLEGIWVREDMRRQGIGARLMARAEEFLIARGFRELGSDALLDNVKSHAAHKGWGFSETERVVYFRKILTT